jgi:hypothetical protein
MNKILLAVFICLFTNSALAKTTRDKITINQINLSCGAYLIHGWIKLERGEAYLVIAKGTQSESVLPVPPINTSEILLLADQPVSAKIKLLDNKKMLIEPQSKNWIQSRIVNFREETNFKKLVQLEKESSCNHRIK